MSDKLFAPAAIYPPPGRDLTALDSSSVFVVKTLFYPAVAVAFLALCLRVSGRSFNGPYFLVAVFAFMGVADFFGDLTVDECGSPMHRARALIDVILRWSGIALCMACVLYLSGLGAVLFDGVLLAWFILMPIALWISAIAAQHMLLHVGNGRGQTRTAVIVGATEQGLSLSRMLQQQPLLRIDSLGFFDDREAGRLPIHASLRMGRMADAAAFVRAQGVHVVYITLPISRHPRILRLLHALHDTTTSIYFVPDLAVLNHIQGRLDVVHGIPMIAVCESPFFGMRSLVKRISDVLISGLVLIGISPLLVAVAVGVKLSSKGPAIFKQRRYGLDGREIMVYKFRSMSVMEDGKKEFTAAARSDSRVTPFGAFIRRTSLDELPQLFNVLLGSMSIVGPRPHPVAMNEHYRGLVPSYMMRHKVKPGITGWAQVNGYRGGDDLESMAKRIEFDLQYLRHWSLWLDLLILLKTATVVWTDKRAY